MLDRRDGSARKDKGTEKELSKKDKGTEKEPSKKDKGTKKEPSKDDDLPDNRAPLKAKFLQSIASLGGVHSSSWFLSRLWASPGYSMGGLRNEKNEKQDLACKASLCTSYRYCMGQFCFIRLLGQGTFGRVFLCQHRPTDVICVLKVLRKNDMINMDHIKNIVREREALLTLTLSNCPFVLKAMGAFQDERHLFFMTEFVQGGEILRYIYKNKRLEKSTARFYAAELVLALEHMHTVHNLAYRDIKPDNILLDRDGHLKLVDFGFTRRLLAGQQAYSLCGSPYYLAPELILGTGHDRAVDYWALGVFIYEMLVGVSPFVSNERCMVYHNILHSTVTFPPYVSASARSLISGLLTVNVDQRLGYKGGGMADIREHRWFKKIDWYSIRHKKCKPPIIPKLNNRLDSSRFDPPDYSKDSILSLAWKNDRTNASNAMTDIVLNKREWETVSFPAGPSQTRLAIHNMSVNNTLGQSVLKKKLRSVGQLDHGHDNLPWTVHNRFAIKNERTGQVNDFKPYDRDNDNKIGLDEDQENELATTELDKENNLNNFEDFDFTLPSLTVCYLHSNMDRESK